MRKNLMLREGEVAMRLKGRWVGLKSKGIEMLVGVSYRQAMV